MFRENFGTDKIVENSYSHSWEGLTETWEQVWLITFLGDKIIILDEHITQVETGVISGLHTSVTKLQEQSVIDKP